MHGPTWYTWETQLTGHTTSLPYFSRRKAKQDSTSLETSVPCLSPGKRINLRSECMNQLSVWHNLLEKGAISQAQYDEFQKKILGDIADLIVMCACNLFIFMLCTIANNR